MIWRSGSLQHVPSCRTLSEKEQRRPLLTGQEYRQQSLHVRCSVSP
jgi:hypothetical protein